MTFQDKYSFTKEYPNIHSLLEGYSSFVCLESFNSLELAAFLIMMMQVSREYKDRLKLGLKVVIESLKTLTGNDSET